MLDPKKLRQNLKETAQQLKKRGYTLDTDRFESLESRRKELQTQTDHLKAKRNELAKLIGQKKANKENTDELISQSQTINEKLETFEKNLEEIQQKLNETLWSIPNIPDDSVPAGLKEEDNIEVRLVGKPKKFDFKPKDHVDLGETLGQMDFKMAAKLTGSRFVVLYDDFVKLHRALIHFMIDIHTKEHGYREVYAPYLVNYDSMFGSGQFPKFSDKPFAVESDSHTYYLIPTAEVPVTNLARDVIFEDKEMPKRFVCHTPCFRSESGSYGKDVRGMLRQHQFEKVELVQFVKPENSDKALEEMTKHSEIILQRLELPYRTVLKCGGDTAFSASKSYDHEVWLPGENRYREIASCSNCTDFQARRMHARWRNPKTGKPELIHTLNSTGLAIGRTFIAVLENHQTKDGHINVPYVLQHYMEGKTKI